MIAVDQYLKHRDRAIARGVDIEAIEGQSISAIAKVERERAQIDQMRRDGWVRNILTVLVGLFVVVLPSISRLAMIGATIAGKPVPALDDWWMNVTTFIGVLSILGLQCPLVLPLVEHLLPRAQKSDEDIEDDDPDTETE